MLSKLPRWLYDHLLTFAERPPALHAFRCHINLCPEARHHHRTKTILISDQVYDPFFAHAILAQLLKNPPPIAREGFGGKWMVRVKSLLSPRSGQPYDGP